MDEEDEEEPHHNSFLDAAANVDSYVLMHEPAAWLYTISGSRSVAFDSGLPGFSGSKIPMLSGQARQTSKGEFSRGQQARQHIPEGL